MPLGLNQHGVDFERSLAAVQSLDLLGSLLGLQINACHGSPVAFDDRDPALELVLLDALPDLRRQFAELGRLLAQHAEGLDRFARAEHLLQLGGSHGSELLVACDVSKRATSERLLNGRVSSYSSASIELWLRNRESRKQRVQPRAAFVGRSLGRRHDRRGREQLVDRDPLLASGHARLARTAKQFLRLRGRAGRSDKRAIDKVLERAALLAERLANPRRRSDHTRRVLHQSDALRAGERLDLVSRAGRLHRENELVRLFERSHDASSPEAFGLGRQFFVFLGIVEGQLSQRAAARGRRLEGLPRFLARLADLIQNIDNGRAHGRPSRRNAHAHLAK